MLTRLIPAIVALLLIAICGCERRGPQPVRLLSSEYVRSYAKHSLDDAIREFQADSSADNAIRVFEAATLCSWLQIAKYDEATAEVLIAEIPTWLNLIKLSDTTDELNKRFHELQSGGRLEIVAGALNGMLVLGTALETRHEPIPKTTGMALQEKSLPFLLYLAHARGDDEAKTLLKSAQARLHDRFLSFKEHRLRTLQE